MTTLLYPFVYLLHLLANAIVYVTIIPADWFSALIG